MPPCNVIVVGASAGGVNSLTELVSRLPEALSAAVAVALHVPEGVPSMLPSILTRSGRMRAVHAVDGEPLVHGRIYVAPPGHHLLVKRRSLRVVRGPNENGHRPAVDPLFRTAARAHGRRVVGVVLSGSLGDGTAGLKAIKERGGTAVVQDPNEALFTSMPQTAIDNVDVDFVGDVPALAAELVRLSEVLASEADRGETRDAGEADANGDEPDIVEMDVGTSHPEEWAAGPSPFSCPECHGVLFEREDGTLQRFRCRTGHAFGPEALAASQSKGIEDAMWTAYRALEENAALLRRLAKRASERPNKRGADRFFEQARGVEARAQIIRHALLSGDTPAD
jgi:two-component system, chemotaxis family, protein-glutamate methylesterase/glutaminase